MADNITTRPLRHEDLHGVALIDREQVGRARSQFYAKRFQALADEPESIVAVAAENAGRLVGFSFAHLLDGEFGGAAPVGVLDAIGVLPDQQREGVATALLGALEAALASRGVRELRTQAEWTEHGIAAFFAASRFRLSPRVVLERALERPMADDLAGEQQLPVRSMKESDLPEIIRLDRKITGRDRTAYLTRKAGEVMRQSGIRMSLVAEVDGRIAGFLMARADFGEFGRTEPIAVLDTIGVDPDRARQRVASALLDQLLLQLASLRAEQVVTEVALDQVPLLAFLGRTGFARSQRLAFEKAIA